MSTKQFQMSGFSVVVTKENENGASFEFWTDESECPAELTPCRMRGTAQLMRSGSFLLCAQQTKTACSLHAAQKGRTWSNLSHTGRGVSTDDKGVQT